MSMFRERLSSTGRSCAKKHLPVARSVTWNGAPEAATLKTESNLYTTFQLSFSFLFSDTTVKQKQRNRSMQVPALSHCFSRWPSNSTKSGSDGNIGISNSSSASTIIISLRRGWTTAQSLNSRTKTVCCYSGLFHE